MPKKPRKNLVNIGLSGSKGRMGQAVKALAGADSAFKLSAELAQSTDWKKANVSAIDVIVDFSEPTGLADALEWCLAHEKPLVSGTTGLSAADFARLKKAGTKIPVLYSANMSAGIAALSAMLSALRGLADWDFQIEEAHHKLKKDRPSGTAILLQEKLQQVLGRDLPLPHAIRGGGIPGIHQIWAMGPDEALVLQHTAFNRKVFAQGALNAARWLIDNKAPGLYDLSDLYKLT